MALSAPLIEGNAGKGRSEGSDICYETLKAFIRDISNKGDFAVNYCKRQNQKNAHTFQLCIVAALSRRGDT